MRFISKQDRLPSAEGLFSEGLFTGELLQEGFLQINEKSLRSLVRNDTVKSGFDFCHPA